MAGYFLQDDGETLLDSNGAKVGTVTDLASRGLFVKPLATGSGQDLTANDIPTATPQSVFTRAGNALSGAMQDLAPELQPYRSAPARPPQTWEQALAPNPSAPRERGLASRAFNTAMTGDAGTQDVYSRAANRVAGDIMAYDGYLEKDNELSPKRVVNALSGMVRRDTSGVFPMAAAIKRIPDDDLGGALMRGLAGGTVDLGAGAGSLLEMAGTAGQMAFPWSSALPSSAPQIATDAGRKVREFFQGPQQIIQQATPEDLRGNILDKPELMADPRWLTENTAKAAVSMYPSIAAGMGFNTVAGAAIGGAQEAAGSFQETRDKGYDATEALPRAAVYGLVSTGLNKLGLDKILEPKAYSSLLQRGMGVLAAGGTEAFTEWLEEPAQAFLQSVGRESTPELIAQVKQAAIEGLNVVPPTLLLGGAGNAAHQAAGGGGTVKTPPIPDFITRAAEATGVDPNYLTKVMMAESGGKADAKASTSSASGLFQFTDGTWAGLVKQYGAQYGLTPDGRGDANQQAIAAALFTRDNRDFLTKTLGREPSDGDLYMAAFLGQGGARQFLAGMGQDPNAPAMRYASPEAVKANKSIFFNGTQPRTAQEVYDLMTAKVGGSMPAMPAGAAVEQMAAQPPAENNQVVAEEPIAPGRPEDTAIPAEENLGDPNADTAVARGQQRADQSMAPPADEWQGHTVEDISRAFPSGRVTETEAGHRVDLPNGKTVLVNRAGEIAIDRPAALASGYTDEQIDNAGSARGSFQAINGTGVITLTEAGRGELGHELFHAAEEMALTPKQIAVVEKLHGGVEERAKAYNAWLNQRGPDKTGVFAAIRRFFGRIRQALRPTAEGVFEKIARGDVWKQSPQGKQPTASPMQQAGAAPNRPASYMAAVYDGFAPQTHASKMVRVEGVNQETGERGSGMMRAGDALDSAAATIEDYKRLLDCL